MQKNRGSFELFSEFSISLENVLYHQRNDQYRQRNNDQDNNDEDNRILMGNVVGKIIKLRIKELNIIKVISTIQNRQNPGNLENVENGKEPNSRTAFK